MTIPQETLELLVERIRIREHDDGPEIVVTLTQQGRSKKVVDFATTEMAWRNALGKTVRVSFDVIGDALIDGDDSDDD